MAMTRDAPDIRFHPVSGPDSRYPVVSGSGRIVRYPVSLGNRIIFYYTALTKFREIVTKLREIAANYPVSGRRIVHAIRLYPVSGKFAIRCTPRLKD